MKRVVLFYIFYILLMSGFTEDKQMPIFASELNLPQYVLLVEVYEENPNSHRYVIGNKKNVVKEKEKLNKMNISDIQNIFVKQSFIHFLNNFQGILQNHLVDKIMR